jgi:DNA-binding transcriptional MerR regulator
LHSIGKLGKMFNISRSTLLYYDSIGLLKPAKISSAGYRLYEDAEAGRLKRIIEYRSAGVPLAGIKKILSGGKENETVSVLFQRLGEINDEIDDLKKQQSVIIKLLKVKEAIGNIEKHKKEMLLEILKKAGIEPKDYKEWHKNFEKNSPQLHKEFLKTIGFSEKDIQKLAEDLTSISHKE